MNKNRDRNQLIRELRNRPIDSVIKVRALLRIIDEGEFHIVGAPDDRELADDADATKNIRAELAYERLPEAIEFLLSEIQRLKRQR